MITIAVLTISDSASKNTELDKSGPLIYQILSAYPSFLVSGTKVVPDDIQIIRSAIQAWVDDNIQWIISTGGTGFGSRDVTPEVFIFIDLPAEFH
jgi:gephyrin